MSVDARTCPVCGGVLRGGNQEQLPCAAECLPAAEHELRTNVAALRCGVHVRRRAELIRRNARLMAVLLHPTRREPRGGRVADRPAS